MRRIKSLTGKMVLLTGAAGGIGSALAKKLFFQEGASLLLACDKNVKNSKNLEKSSQTINCPKQIGEPNQRFIFLKQICRLLPH